MTAVPETRASSETSALPGGDLGAASTSPALNVLFVSIAFPPKSDPEALQAARYFKYLVRQPGLSIDVVTSRNPTLWMPTDEQLRVYASGVRQHIDVPIFEPRLASVALLKLFPSYVNLPDMRQSFHWQWRRVTRALQRRPDLIYTRSFPLSSTIMGQRLARHYGVPWIMHLSDPWTESAIMNFTGVSRLYNLRAQSECFEQAAAITLASPRMVDFYRSRFPRLAGKFHLAPNVYDPDDVVTPAPRGPGPLRLVYTGSLRDGRSIRHLLAILEWCAARAPEALKNLSVELAGSLDSSERELLAANRFPFVRHVGALSLTDAQRLQRDADMLLVLDSRLRPEDSVFFPSKLLDYLVTGRPIMAITSPGSMTREIVTDGLGRCFDHDDAAAAGAYLLECLARHGAGGAAVSPAPIAQDDRFSAAVNARRLADLMRGLQ
jgi:glycosyltransferase involved in cell wall biosynthesis